jgi:uncharacterized protein (TIGR02246 family)
MKYWKGPAVAVLATLLLSCVGAAGEQEVAKAAPENDDAAEAAVAAAGEKLVDAYVARDLERWLAGFTEDVVLMPPGVGMIVGLDALREASQVQFGLLEEYETQFDGEPLEIVVAGDWAYTRDGYELRYLPAGGGEPILDRGRSMTIWKRQSDGAWLVSRHMANRPTRGPG